MMNLYKTTFFHFRRLKLLNHSINVCLRCAGSAINADIDVMDNFTSELIQKRINKYDVGKIGKKTKLQCPLQQYEYNMKDFANISQTDLNRIMSQYIDDGNFKKIDEFLTQCRRNKRGPNLVHILSLLDTYAHHIELDLIEKIKETMEQCDLETYLSNGRFDHYLAFNLWLNGNITKALAIFEAVYKENNFLRRKIREMLRYLTLDVTNKSEAVLVNLIKFAELISSEFNDYFILTSVWQACFLSEWFVDQQLATSLLYKHIKLHTNLPCRLPYIVAVSLKQHKTDNIFRLLEVLLKYQMHSEYVSVMLALFDYRFKQGDLRSCKEIVNWFNTNNVNLPKSINLRFLTLLVGGHSSEEPEVATTPPNYKF